MSARGVPARRLRWLLGVLCVLESLADFAASKCRHGDNLALLAFGAVSLRLLDLGDPYYRKDRIVTPLDVIQSGPSGLTHTIRCQHKPRGHRHRAIVWDRSYRASTPSHRDGYYSVLRGLSGNVNRARLPRRNTALLIASPDAVGH